MRERVLLETRLIEVAASRNVKFRNVLISARELRFDERRPRERLDYAKQAE